MAISKFVPRTDGTGSIGTSNLSWNEGHFNNATFKQDITVTGNADIGGTATISNINSTNVTVTGGIEYAAGTTSLQGESSPTGAAPSSTVPITSSAFSRSSLHLYALPNNKFYAFSLFGDLSIKEGNSPWRKTGKGASPFDSTYFSASGMVHTKLSNGTDRLWLSVLGKGSSGGKAFISDDYGDTWTQAPGASPQSTYYGGGRSKSNQYSFSNDIRNYDDLVHWASVYSYYNSPSGENNPATGRPWTIAELSANHLTGDNEQASRVQHAFLQGFIGWYQCYAGDDLWDAGVNPYNLITVDMIKNFKIISNGEFATFNKAYGQNANGLSTNTRRLSTRLMGDSRWDIMAAYASTYPGTDATHCWVRGVKKILTALGNGETVDDAWFAARNPNDFWIGTWSHLMAEVHVTMSADSEGGSNADVIYMGPHFYPTDFVSRPDDFVNLDKFNVSGPKRWNPIDSDGEPLGDWLKVTYVDENALVVAERPTGRTWEIDTAALRSAIVLNNSDGSDWNGQDAQAAITKYKPNVIVDGVDVPLNDGGGEASNSDSVATANIHQYTMSNPNGAIVGLGDNGYATYRDLSLDNYSSLGSVWKNTTANSFSVPAFASSGIYHGGLKKLHFDFRKSFQHAVPSLSVDASNNWSSGFVGTMPSYSRLNPLWDDSSTPKFGGRNGDAQYTSQYTSTGISWYYNGNFQTTANIANTVGSIGYGRIFPGSGRNYTPPGYLTENRQTHITLSNGDTLVTLYARMNSGTWTTDRWIGWYATQLTQYADETFSNKKAARAWSNSHHSSGDSHTYYQTCLTQNNRMTRNGNRNDFATHPNTIDAIAISGSSTGVELSGNATGIDWHRNADSSGRFRKVGVYFPGQTGAVAFTRPSDTYNFESTSDWNISLVCRNNTSVSIPITATRTSRDGWVVFDFTTPTGTVNGIMTAAGIDSNMQTGLVWHHPTDGTLKRLGVYFQVQKTDGTQGFRKFIEIRDGSPTDWKDQPLVWESRDGVDAPGNMGWIFGSSGHDNYRYRYLYQMPNGDLIAGNSSNWKIVALESLDGDNGLYIDDPTWVERATRPQYFGKSYQDQTSIFDGTPVQITATITALSDNHMMVYRSNTTAGYLETDGNGNLVRGVRVNPPDGQTPNAAFTAIKASETLYFQNKSEGRIWYTSIPDLLTLGQASNNVTPDWTEINLADTGLSAVYGISYHPVSETYYLSGNSGLYSKSTNGKTNWSIDISPQYGFASQPTTGLYKDLEHNLHLVHKGDLSLSIGEESLGSLKPLGLGTKSPDFGKNLTIQALSDVSGDQTVIQFRDIIGEDIGKIEVDTSANTTKYTTTSDYRLKLDITSFNNPVDRLMSLKPCGWTWKNSGLKGEGFIAHEVSEIIPEAVSGEKDATKTTEYTIPNQYNEEPTFETVINEEGEEVEVEAAPEVSIAGRTITKETPVYQSIDQSKLVPLLTASLQETIKELNSLKDRVQKLEDN